MNLLLGNFLKLFFVLFFFFFLSCKERLVSLVFGLLKQRKLNFYEIYGDEMIITAKNIIKQVSQTIPTYLTSLPQPLTNYCSSS